MQARVHAQNDEQLAGKIVECAERAAALDAIDKQIAPARKEADLLHDQTDEARASVSHLGQEHAAVALRAGLATGDHCPVCEAIIEKLPETDSSIDALLERAKTALARLEARAGKARSTLIALEAQRQGAAGELDKARAALPRKMVEVPTLAKARTALTRAEAATAAAQKAEAGAQTVLQRASAHLSEAQTAAATASERAAGLASKHEDTKKRLQSAQAVLRKGFGERLPRDINAQVSKRRKS